MANRESLNLYNQQMTLKPVLTSGRSKVTSIVNTMNLELNSTCRRKKTFPFHWNTLTLLGPHTLIWRYCNKKKDWRLLELRFEQVFVRFMERTHKIHSFERSLQKDTCGPGRDWRKMQATTRPDHVWPEIWTRIRKAAQNREKQEWATEKSKTDNGRKLRGIYFNDPENGQGDGVSKACLQQAAADSWGSQTCVCASIFGSKVAHAGEEGRINVVPWYRPVGVVSTSSESHKAGERSTFRWNGRQLTLVKTVGSRVWWHTRGLGELRLDPEWKPSAQEDGSGVAIDWVTGRSCSSGLKAGRRLNVQSGPRKGDKGRAQPEPSVIVGTEKVCAGSGWAPAAMRLRSKSSSRTARWSLLGAPRTDGTSQCGAPKLLKRKKKSEILERQHSSLRQLSAGSTIGNDKEFKTMYGCMVKSVFTRGDFYANTECQCGEFFQTNADTRQE